MPPHRGGQIISTGRFPPFSLFVPGFPVASEAKQLIAEIMKAAAICLPALVAHDHNYVHGSILFKVSNQAVLTSQLDPGAALQWRTDQPAMTADPCQRRGRS